ncbi:hypothetical protein KCV01_g21360, partial [Aureobasidium melanogenum]
MAPEIAQGSDDRGPLTYREPARREMALQRRKQGVVVVRRVQGIHQRMPPRIQHLIRRDETIVDTSPIDIEQALGHIGREANHASTTDAQPADVDSIQYAASVTTDDACMNPIDAPERCPVHHAPDPMFKSAWPPGPRAGLTGWRFLRAMSRDLLGSLSAWRRAHGDLVHLRIWPEHQILVADPHVARELLVGHHDALIRWEPGMRAFARSQGHSVLVAEGESWKAKRRALQPSFSHRASRDALPLMVAATRQALDRWAPQAYSFALDDALTSLTVNIITRLLFSRDAESASPHVRQAVHALLAEINSEFYRPLTLPDWLPWNRERREARRLLLNMIQSRLQERLVADAKDWPDDLLSRLLHLHIADPVAWSSQDVLDECMTAFLAGHETLAATLV